MKPPLQFRLMDVVARASTRVGISVALLTILGSTLLFPPSPWKAWLAAALALLLGISWSASLLRALLQQAAHGLERDQRHGTFPELRTGFDALDDFVTKYQRRINHLIETVGALGQESEALIERYELLTDNIAASIVLRDGAGRITYCSPYTEVLTGYTLSEIYSAPEDFFRTIVHPADLEQYARSNAVTACGEAFQSRFRIFHKSGIEMWVETRSVPVQNDQGEVTSSITITLDITGIVRYQRQVEEKNKDLQDFAYMVSHDLKAPIVTIKGMLSALDEDYGKQLDHGAHETIAHMARATERLAQLTASIIEYSRASTQQAKSERVALRDVLRDVLADHEQDIKSRHAAINIPAELPTVRGDRTKLYQVFSNLIGNALKFQRPDIAPHITISVQPHPNPRTIGILLQDNGCGIPSDKLETIFRPFQRGGQTKTEGSGVGLACVKRLLEKLGGEITVQSQPDQGSCFTLTLPLEPAEHGASISR